MQAELKRLQRATGITFVFVTHDQEEALTMSDRIAVMTMAVGQVGSPRDIYDHPADRFVADFIGEANMLTGELVLVEGARGVVRLGDGIELPASVPERAPRSGLVTVVVRPEHAAPAASRTLTACRRWWRTPSSSAPIPSIIRRLADGAPFVVRRQNTSADIVSFAVGSPVQVLLGEHALQVLRD